MNRNKTLKKESQTLPLLVILTCFLFGLSFALINHQILILIFSMIVSLPLAYSCVLFFSSTNSKKTNEKYNSLIEFYWYFYHYSTLLNSYDEGFKYASSSLKESHLKDDLTDYLENPTNELPLSCFNTRIETKLNQFIYRLCQLEETSYRDLNDLKHLIKEYERERPRE